MMSRKDFVKFLGEFRDDLKHNPKEWENTSLDSFLEAMQGYTQDIQGFHDLEKTKVDHTHPSWETFKVILQGASVYE